MPYAFAFSVAPDTVTANTSLTLPNLGGADGRNVYADGLVFTRQRALPAGGKPWTGDVDHRREVPPRLRRRGDDRRWWRRRDHDAAHPHGDARPRTSPSGTTPDRARDRRKALALKAAKGKPRIPATFTCYGAALSGCSLTVTPPKGARSVKVDVLRGSKVVASGAASRKTAGTGKRRTLRLSAK